MGDESVDKPDSVSTASGRRRSSICDCCCQQPGAIYPETRASSPQAPPQTRERVLLILLQVGFTEPSQSPGMLVVSYTAVSPLPPCDEMQAPHRLSRRRSVLCGTVPRVTPGGRYPPPCSVESGLSSTMQVHRRDRLTDSSIVQPSQQRYGCVRTSAPFSVTTMVCSNWAHRLPSAVSTVQPSSHMYQPPAPKVIMGSMVKVIPGLITVS